jgi:hypothetical protein
MARRLRPKGTRYAVGVGQIYFLLGLIAVSGGLGDGFDLIGGVVGLALFGVCVPFIWRSGVYATATGITLVPLASRPTEYGWASIERFKVGRASVMFGIYAVFTDGTETFLPSTACWSPLRPKMQRIADALAKDRSHALALQPAAPSPPAATDVEHFSAGRRNLKRAQHNAILVGLGGLACGVAGFVWTADPRWLGLAAAGAFATLTAIPIQVVIKAIDRRLAADGTTGQGADCK